MNNFQCFTFRRNLGKALIACTLKNGLICEKNRKTVSAPPHILIQKISHVRTRAARVMTMQTHSITLLPEFSIYSFLRHPSIALL